MSTKKPFVVKHGLEVSDNLLFAQSEKVGVQTAIPEYNLDVRGDIAFTGKLYSTDEVGTYTTTGTLDSSEPNFISGIDTSVVRVNDRIDDGGGSIVSNTKIVTIGISSIGISPSHSLSVGSTSTSITITRYLYPGNDGDILVSRGDELSPVWRAPSQSPILDSDTSNISYPTFTNASGFSSIAITTSKTSIIPSSGSLGLGTDNPEGYRLKVDGNSYITGILTVPQISSSTRIDVGSATTLTGNKVETETIVSETVSSTSFFGSGVNLSGIVTQITAGIGIDLSPTNGKGSVEVTSYKPIGKTIFVSQTGSDTNTGLSENHPKRTIKAAAAIAFPGDTIKVYPGVYVENNPIQLSERVSVEGTELRNCVVTPKYLNRDLFHVNNSCHVTDLSFVSGDDMTDGAAIIALQPLLGVSTDRYFDAARMIRYNLDFIASETVGYLTSTDYRDPAFSIPTGNPTDCKDDIKDIMKAVIHDITRGGNLKCVGAGKSYYTSEGALQHIVGVKTETIDALNYAAGIAKSCINNVTWTGDYQSEYTQVKDLAMQADSATGSNQDIASCADVVSAIYSCVGVVTTIIDQGLTILGSGINTTFPANSGVGTDSIIGITSAVYNNASGETTIVAPSFSVKEGDIVEVRDLLFECESGGNIGTQAFPSGRYGYLFDVIGVTTSTNTFTINTGVSTIPHSYVSGGYVVNRAIGVTTASYDNTTGITTITAPGAVVKVGQFVKLHDLEFSCTSGAGTTTLYPTGNLGYEFRVTEVTDVGNTFVVNVGPSTIPHTYESGGVVFPPYSPGVGPITQGPYVRNCTNFVPKSIGMKVDGFEAEPGDQDDIGVTGTMSVDSYTQYNQGGIGVSITNGAYAQLVSIFTICDDIAIFTGSGGQCDITNSNSSFGRLGLVANGVGDAASKSIYRYTGAAVTDATSGNNIVSISGVGTIRPYDGQVCYFGELYNFVDVIEVTNGGSGYSIAPRVTISAPDGENGITAQATTTIDDFGRVTSVNIVNSGSQYLNPPTITIDPPNVGVGAAATVTSMQPIYYKVDSATLPSAGISTVSFLQNLNNTVSAGTTVYFTRVSLQITSSHSFEWVGSGNDINKAKPALGGVVIPENEVIQEDGGIVVYTSTDQAGNFKIGDGVIINQATGQITGRDFTKALFTTMTPFILALSE